MLEDDIRSDYIPGKMGHGAASLGRKYGLDDRAIMRVVNGGTVTVKRGGTRGEQVFNWTDDAIATLTRLWNEDIPASAIGREMGITKSSVLGKVHRLKLSARNPQECAIQSRKPSPRKPRPARKISIAAEFLPNQRVPEFKTEPLDLRGSKAWEPLEWSFPKTLLEVKEHQCRWPVNTEGPFSVCGLPTARNRYCEHHASLAYRTPTQA